MPPSQIINIKFCKTRSNTVIPTYANKGDCGLDLRASLEKGVVKYILSGETVKIPLGFATEIPEGWAVLILPRSGLAAKQNITIQNTPGLIDSGYRGEWCVLLRNEGRGPFFVRSGDRIAQAILIQNHTVNFTETKNLVESKRGKGGFGSTGVK